MKIKCECHTCKIEFERYKCHIKPNTTLFCSRECLRQYKLGKPSNMKGKKHSEEAKEKNRQAHIGMKAWNKGVEYHAIKGDKNPNWKGGISKINKTERQLAMYTLEYKAWRTAVFERDNYTCVNCNTRGCKLNADHIKAWVVYPDLRYDIDNGRTLCVDCHKQIGWSLFKENNPRKLQGEASTNN